MCRHILRQLKPGLIRIGTFTIIFVVVEVSRVITVVTVATNATSVSESTCNVHMWLRRRGAHISPGLCTGLFLLIGIRGISRIRVVAEVISNVKTVQATRVQGLAAVAAQA